MLQNISDAINNSLLFLAADELAQIGFGCCAIGFAFLLLRKFFFRS